MSMTAVLYADAEGAGRRVTPVRRIVLVILDGLRPDAIEVFGLSNLRRFVETGAASLKASTVTPSSTSACIASLLTGVSPVEHGVRADTALAPRSVTALARQVANEGYQTSAFLSEIPLSLRGTAARLGRELGFQQTNGSGTTSAEILRNGIGALCSQLRGLIVMHFPDADRAGRDFGWMSLQYGEAARRIDQSVGLLASLARIHSDPEALLVVVADHGGGGADPRRHDSEHPLDLTIPVILAGRSVESRSLPRVHLLDVPPTILWALGISVPRNYEGRVLREAFATAPDLATAVA